MAANPEQLYMFILLKQEGWEPLVCFIEKKKKNRLQKHETKMVTKR